MKLHSSAVEKIMQLFATFSGYPNEKKLKEAIVTLDFSTYEKKTGNRETVVVLTEDYIKSIQQK